MKALRDQLKRNFAAFSGKLRESYSDSFGALDAQKGIYESSYTRLCSLEAWVAFLLESKLNEQSLAFFREAQTMRCLPTV